MPYRVIFLPGIILPAHLRYAPLIGELGNDVEPLTKELEVYRDDQPPVGYSIDTEVDGLLAAADEAGYERFHLYGHSGGGAVALAFGATHPERLLSLAVDEPANDFVEDAYGEDWQEIRRIAQLPERERVQAFLQAQVKPGVQLPPPPEGPPPPWFARRPAGIDAFSRAVEAYRVDPSRYRAFERPVYFSYGSLTHPRWEAMRARLEALFPDFTSELYEGLHHLNTSHQAQPARVADALRKLWGRAAAKE